ncbi:MAG: ATP-binding protein, partial [Chitinophagaceae bacterium]
EAQLTELDKNFQHTNQDKQDRLERLRRKYQPLIKGIKDQVTEQGYLLERGNDQLQQATLALKELESKAATEKKILIESLDDNIVTATTNLANSSLALEAIDANLKKQVRAKEKELDKKIDTLHSNQRNAEMELEATRAELAKELQRSVAATQLRQQEELNGHGVDTNRLSELEDAITQTNKRLAAILQNRAVVIEYLKDKRELFDKADELKTKKQAGETQVDYEQKRFTQVVENAHAEIKVQEEKIRSVTEEILRLQSDLASYEDFSISDNYIRIEPEFKQVNELYANEKSCRHLIDKINEAVYAGLQKSEVLKENINRFAGNFSSANVFNFKISFTSNDDYVAFADDLNEFIHNSKIEEYEKRVNERFATIINTVGNQTSSLMSRAGEIQKVITQINNDFQTRNFVGAIRKIELKLDQSTNRVVQLLLEIKKFNDEYSYDLGGMNLFSSADQQSKNQKATDLLRNFGRAIAEYKIEVINLSDSFELKFRIEENDNDTGWVEKLANVGSEGTDVLVKAMINIMLLNVFKNDASRKFKDFRLHCMMDEIGKLHPNNVRGILQFANDRNIFLINGSPTENNALDYKHIYKLEKDSKRHTRIKRIISRTTV